MSITSNEAPTVDLGTAALGGTDDWGDEDLGSIDDLEFDDAEVEEEFLAWAPAEERGHSECHLLPVLPDGGLVRGSMKPYMIHAMRIDSAVTACGISLSDRHTMLPGWPEVPWPRCRRCFRPL